MNNLKDIHNGISISMTNTRLFYQDFNEQFEGYTQPLPLTFVVFQVVLSGFQWTIWRIYTTFTTKSSNGNKLFYQDFNEQFEGYTQQDVDVTSEQLRCFIRISMNNLKDIHNGLPESMPSLVLFYQDFNEQFEGYTQPNNSISQIAYGLFYQDFNEQFEGYTQRFWGYIVYYICCFIRISMNNLKDIHNII